MALRVELIPAKSAQDSNFVRVEWSGNKFASRGEYGRRWWCNYLPSLLIRLSATYLTENLDWVQEVFDVIETTEYENIWIEGATGCVASWSVQLGCLAPWVLLYAVAFYRFEIDQSIVVISTTYKKELIVKVAKSWKWSGLKYFRLLYWSKAFAFIYNETTFSFAQFYLK